MMCQAEISYDIRLAIFLLKKDIYTYQSETTVSVNVEVIKFHL